MKLYNRTRCPDAVLAAVLNAAGKLSGARTAGVVVKVTAGASVRGLAFRADWVRLGFLTGRGFSGTSRKVGTDRGYYRIILPCRAAFSDDPIKLAQHFFQTAIHEWVHIRDFQHHECFCNFNRRWANRPHERRAVAATNTALDLIRFGLRSDPEDEILALAIWLEEQNK